MQPFTKYDNIKSILPGEILTIDYENKLTTKFYNSIRDIIISAENSDKKFKEDELIDLLKSEININLISDVKNSIMLSSGIDSLFIHEQTNQSLSTFTLSNQKYINSKFDEINNLKKLGINITMFKYLKNEDIDNDNIKNILKINFH